MSGIDYKLVTDRLLSELTVAAESLPGDKLPRPAPEGVTVVRLLTGVGIVERILVRRLGEGRMLVTTLDEWGKAQATGAEPSTYRYWEAQAVE